MELIEIPLENHYMLVTHKGFATFVLLNEDSSNFYLQDVPLRFIVNALSADKSDTHKERQLDSLLDRFRFLYLKYYGMPMQAISLREVINKHEKPLESLYNNFIERDQKALEKAIKETCLFPFDQNKTMIFRQSPLFVFTRNGMVDM